MKISASLFNRTKVSQTLRILTIICQRSKH